jgi:hypothetical protein
VIRGLNFAERDNVNRNGELSGCSWKMLSRPPFNLFNSSLFGVGGRGTTYSRVQGPPPEARCPGLEPWT